MRAAIFDGPGRPLRIATTAMPIAGPTEVVIEVAACGLCGSDLHATADEHGHATRGGILGHEFSGTISAVGSDVVESWKLGDRVYAMPFGSCGTCPHCQLARPEECEDQHPLGALGPGDCNGAYAEFVAASAVDLLLVPHNVSFEVAALVEPLATGLMCVQRAGLAIGDRVLILGAGAIGQAIALWARFFGARRVVVVDLVAERLALATQLGATDTITAAAVDGVEVDVGERFEALTGGPPDVVIEAVGRPGMLNRAMSLVRPQGRVVTGGVCMEPDSFNHLLAYFKEPIIRTARIYTKAENEFILEMIATGRIGPSPLITHRVSLDELPAAFEALRHPTDQCKVIVSPVISP